MKSQAIKVLSIIGIFILSFVVWSSGASAAAPTVCTDSSALKGTVNSSGACAANAATNAALRGTFTMQYPQLGLSYSLTGSQLIGGYELPAGTDLGGNPELYSLVIPTNDKVVVSCDLGPTNFAGGTGSFPYPPSGNTFTGPGTFYPVYGTCGSMPSWSYVYGNLIFTLMLPTVPATTTATTSSATITSTAISSGVVTIIGTGFSATGNSVYVSAPALAVNNTSSPVSSTNNGTMMTWTVPNTLPGGTYALQVKPLGATSYSNAVSVVIPSAAPSGLTATMSSTNVGKVNLSWTAGSNATGYSIERSFDGTAFTVIKSTGVSPTSYTDDLSIANITGSQDIYRVRAVYADGTYSAYTSTASVSNCVSVSGSGPRKIVFMRGKAMNLSIQDFISLDNPVIASGFGAIDPYKTYLSQFTFYEDLKMIDEAGLPRSTSGGASVLNSTAAANVKSNSSCGAGAAAYVFWNGDTSTYAAITQSNVSFVRPGVFNNYSIGTTGNVGFPDTVIHEVSHAIADLADEYTSGTEFTGSIGDENCAHDPSVQYKNTIDGITYAGLVPGDTNGGEPFYAGCTVMSDALGQLYRPSRISIMNSGALYFPKFNVISCGYVVSAILGEPIDKAHAQTHWSQCFKSMDTRKAEVSTTTAATQIITLSGAGTSDSNPIFSMVDSNITGPNSLPSTIRMSPSGSSIAKESALLQADIDQALEQGNRVMVIGHSLGSLIAYSVINKYFSGNPAVAGIYIDPPYNMPGILTAFRVSSGNSASNISNDPNVVNWTHGLAMLELFRHDPFDYQWFAGNSTDLSNLWPFINSRLAVLNANIATPTAGPNPSPLAVVPSVSVTPASVASGQTVTLTGSNFDSSNNTVFIQSTANPSLFYTIYGLAPSSGSLSFVLPYSPDIPQNTVPGAYTIMVSGTNTDWSPSIPFTITAPTLTTAPTVSVAPSTATPGNSVTLTGSGFGATTNIVFTPNSSSSYNADGTSFMANIFQAWKSFWNAVSTLLFGSTPQAHAQTSSTYALKLVDVPTTGSSVTFTIPSDLPSGTYNVQVGSDGQALSSVQTIIVGLGNTTPITGTPGTSGAPSTISATSHYTCTSGYTLQSDNTCYKAGDSTTSTSKVAAASFTKTCPTGYSPSSSGDYCRYTNGSGNIAYNLSYSCLSGGTIDYSTGWVFETLSGAVSAQYKNYWCMTNTTNTTPASTVAGTVSSYSCPAGYTDDTSDHSTCDLNQGPVSLAATVGSGTSGGTVNLTWSNNSVLNVKNVEVDRGISNDPSAFTALTTLGPTITTYSDASGLPGTTYYYQVRQIYQNGNYSTASGVKSVTVGVNSTSTVAVLNSLSDQYNAGDSLTLTGSGFKSGSNPVSKDAIQMTLGSAPNISVVAYLQSMTPSSDTALSFVIPSYLPSGTYYINISPYDIPQSAMTHSSSVSINVTGSVNSSGVPTYVLANSTGCPSGYAPYSIPYSSSSIICTIAPTPTTTPKSLTASASTQGQVKLTWSNNSATGFTGVSVERASAKAGPYTQVGLATSTTYIDTGLAQSTAYYYSVRLQYGSAYGPYSATTTVTTAKTTVPSSLKATVSSASAINLSWTDGDTGIASYTINQASPSSASYSSTGKTYSVTGLNSSTKYCFTVSSYVNVQNSSAATAQTCATTKAGTISIPTTPTTPVTPVPSTPITTSATLTYTCSSGTLSGTKCIASSTVTKSPTTSYKCSTGYTLNSAKSCTKRGSVTVSATATYTCSSGYTLNTNDNLCHSNATVTTSAATTYSCPADYTLNSSTKKCTSNTTSMTDSSASSTASVWDAITEWFWGWFR